MATAAPQRVFRLPDALSLLLLPLLPVMFLLGASEGRAGGPTLLFWLLLLIPLAVLAWLLTCCEPEETAAGQRVAALKVPRNAGVVDTFESLVAPVVQPRRRYVEAGVPVVEGTPTVHGPLLFSQLDRRLAPYGVVPLVEAVDDNTVRVVGLPKAVDSRLRARSSPVVNLVLFAATVVTTVYAGARQQGVDLLQDPGRFTVGLPYAVALLSILGVHEFGHYFMARRHGVDVTLPYFIPVPMGFGTFGAFIQIKSLIKTRRAVFDIGIAGPLAGLVVAIPLLYFGVTEGSPVPNANAQISPHAASSLFLAWIYQLTHGGDLGSAAVHLSPTAFAAWIGVFITGLNLLPVGQLDGGHISYALFGRRHARTVSIVTVALMVVLGLLVWPGLLTWALILTLVAGFSHMPALDDVTPPDGKRFALGALALVLPMLILFPLPGAFGSPRLDSPYQGDGSNHTGLGHG